MGRLRLGGVALIAIVLSLGGVSGCGGHSTPGVSPYPARVNLTPATSTSVQIGSILGFSATAQNSSGNNVSTSFTFVSSDTSVLNLAPNGVACAGHWDAAYTTCTPGGIGVVQVTASAFGATSAPTYVFVHPPIDNIKVTGALLDAVPVQEPCLSQGQSMTVEAHAYSQGTDITASVGPFIWSANRPSVVKLTPLINLTYSFATNQATATAAISGITQIYATASGVSSNTFYQPQYKNSSGVTSPLLDFFETCPIQNITLELGHAGSLENTFTTTKGTSQTAIATITDVMGNNSLPNSNNPVILSEIPLTWTATQPSVIATGSGCTESCSITTPSPGAGSVTASCSPPTCNIGYPEVPVALSTPASLAACAQFFQLPSCEPFIPLPVYSSPPRLSGQATAQGQAGISGVVTGATATTSVLATSTGCTQVNPLDCSTAIYSASTSKSVAGAATPLPDAPNSLLFDLAGDRAFMGSEVSAVAINPTSFGTTNNPFSSVGSVTGKVLAVSHNGAMAVFSDTQLVPNQVFIVNTAASAGAPSVIPLGIAAASAAAFSPDGSRAYIFGLDTTGKPNLYIYSTLQSLETIPLLGNTTVNAITFSTNAAFAYVVEPMSASGPPAVTVYNTCVHDVTSPQLVAQIFSLNTTPVAFKALPDGQHFVALGNDGTVDYITATMTGIPVATTTNQAPPLCPMTVSHTVKNINLGQGSFHPVDIFTSPDGTLFYVLASDRSSVLVYNFATGATTGIELVNNATPLSGYMTSDAGTIAIAGSDGMLHSVSTAFGGSDMVPPLQFPNLPNYGNSFCTFTPASGPCLLNLLAVKP